MRKVALYVFNGSPMCFVHVLLNALDMHQHGDQVQIVMEGEATKLVAELEKPANGLHGPWRQALQKQLVAGACRACSQKLGALAGVEAAGLPLLADMQGHPGMVRYREAGYEILTF